MCYLHDETLCELLHCLAGYGRLILPSNQAILKHNRSYPSGTRITMTLELAAALTWCNSMAETFHLPSVQLP